MGYGHVAERTGLALNAAGLAPARVPAPVLDAYLGAFAARVIMGATSLGVFAALQAGPRTPDDVARCCSIDAAGADVLLTALHSLGYVRSRGDGYELTAMTRRWLVPDSPDALDGFIGGFVPLAWDHMAELEDRLRDGGRIGLHERDPDDPYWDHYMRAMLELSRLAAPATARAIPAHRPKRLLDLGGGPGGHAMAMCQRHLGLRATVVDLEGAARRGRAFVAAAGMADRVTYEAGDVLEADLGGGYDVATCHQVLHTLAPEQCVAVLRRARAALRPGGTMAVLELERPPDGRRGTRASTLLGVLFHLLCGTRTWTAAELEAWFAEAGFSRVRVRRPSSLPGSIVVVGRNAQVL
jgi:2-polyprenyl-3-methyl-5-hydroxy-6-metoxy-1,4-benzoquinol methylase